MMWLWLVADPRVETWFLMQTPVPVILLFFLYIAVVLIGPKFMKNIQPLNLKTVLVLYNFTMVALSVYMFLEASTYI